MVFKLIFLTLFSSISLFANVKFWKYEDAMREAAKTDKIVAVTVVSTNCPWCHKLMRETIKNGGVQSILQKDFLYVVINRDNTELPNGISSRIMVPTTFFYDKNGEKLISPAVGYWNAEDFSSFLGDALRKKKK